MNPKKNKRNLWKKSVDNDKYQLHVTISTIGSTTESAEEIDDKIVYMEDLKKRKQAYGICGECNEPGTGLKCTEFLNEIKTHLQIYLYNVIQCYGITQDPNTKDYMMVLEYYLITKCWDAKAENRPTAKELYQELEVNFFYEDSSQRKEYNDKIKLNRTSEKRSSNIQTHPQAIYTSRLLNFKNLPEPVNSDATKTSSLRSECFDCQLDELDLNESDQDEENNTE
ncbi:kinase-like domain-containing protein [Rhizophagus irregularis DAOM 181602=DAOM 197198]|nr:kinase-like domain-containing protein [Rhizophagus irregularis DAOM 181602=DAOM 197198]